MLGTWAQLFLDSSLLASAALDGATQSLSTLIMHRCESATRRA